MQNSGFQGQKSLGKYVYRISANSFLPWIVSPLQYFPRQLFNLLSKKISIMRKLYENFHIFHFQKRIVSAKTIRGNTVLTKLSVVSCRAIPFQSRGADINRLSISVLFYDSPNLHTLATLYLNRYFKLNYLSIGK